MKKVGYLLMFLIGFILGIIQSFIGFIAFLVLVDNPHYFYKGCIVTIVPGRWGGISVGNFLFLDEYISKEDADTSKFLRHEYGHYLQHLILGPLYCFIILLPSLCWAGFGFNYGIKHGMSYYDFYTERLADKLGGVKR